MFPGGQLVYPLNRICLRGGGPDAGEVPASFRRLAMSAASRVCQRSLVTFQLSNFIRIQLTVSPNESESQHFSEASAAELPPQASASSHTSKAPSPLMRAGLWASRLESMFIRRLMVVGSLGLLVMIGLFLSNYSSEKARFYWCAMFPIFGIACLAHELAAGRAYEIALWRILLRQALHWIGPIVAVKILFLQHARGQMATDAVALTIILLLAVTCFLAGVHFDRSFYWVSAFLALAAVIGTEIETYLWFAVVLVLIAAAIAVLSGILLRRGSKGPADPVHSPTS